MRRKPVFKSLSGGAHHQQRLSVIFMDGQPVNEGGKQFLGGAVILAAPGVRALFAADL